MQPEQGVSIVLPCYNRGAYLARWLEAFAWWHPHRLPVEILVVDDGGADHTPAVVELWRERGLDVRYTRLRAPGAPRNNAQARNAGVRAARYSLVLNADPEGLFATDVVGSLVDAWKPGTFCSPAHYYPLTKPATLDLWRAGERRALEAADWLARARGRQDLVYRPDGVRVLHGAFLCDRETLIGIRGYDERFRCWGWEDHDLLTRLEQGLGFRRCYVDGVTIIHQWHPELRSDQGADRSRVLWQMGWQQACAAALTSVERNPGGWGEAVPDDEESVPPWSRVAALGRDAWNQMFDAYLYEAQAWRREGQPRTAIERLRIGLGRWWESREQESAAPGTPGEQVARASDAGYARAGDAALEYARAALAAGDRETAEEAWREAARLPDSAHAAATLRATWLIREGRLDEADRVLEDEAREKPTAECVALLTEVFLRLGCPERARDAADAALSLPGVDLDTFERLLFDVYRAQLAGPAPSGRAWPPRVAGASAGEFLFSVAMRARRDGLVFGAMGAFDACLALDEGLDDELRERARRLRDETGREWAELLDAARGGASAGPGSDGP